LIPYKISIQLTSDCNWRCKCCICFKDDDNIVREYMSDYIFKKIIVDIKEFKSDIPFIHLVHYVGEPTLHPKFIEYIHTLSNEFVNSTIVFHTNGSAITPVYLEKLPKNITIVLSCLGGKYNYQNYTSQTWDYFLKCCDILYKSDLKFLINLTTDGTGLKESIADLIKFDTTIVLNAFLDQRISLEYLGSIHRLFTNTIVENNLHDIQIVNTQDIFSRFDSQFFINSSAFKRYGKYCSIPHNDIHINTQGKIILCLLTTNIIDDAVFGDINIDSISNIFNSNMWDNIRTRLSKGIPGCKYCADTCSYRFSNTIPKALYL